MIPDFWKHALLFVLTVVGAAVVFCVVYSIYLERAQKRADDFLKGVLREARANPFGCSTNCIYEICQLYLGIPLRHLQPQPAAGFSPKDVRLLVALALLIGDTAKLNYGWYGVVGGGGLERNGDPQLWLSCRASKTEDYVIQSYGGDAVIMLGKVFYSCQNKYLAVAATIDSAELHEVVHSDTNI